MIKIHYESDGFIHTITTFSAGGVLISDLPFIEVEELPEGFLINNHSVVDGKLVPKTAADYATMAAPTKPTIPTTEFTE